MKKYSAIGKVKYRSDWLIISVNDSIVDYYKTYIEKITGKKISKSYHDPHITIIAGKYYPNVQFHPFWGVHHNKIVKFEYSNEIKTDKEWFFYGNYYWINVFSPFFNQMRQELDLEPESHWPFHLTIGYKQ